MFGMELYGLLFLGCFIYVISGSCMMEVLKCAAYYRPISAEKIFFGPDFDLEKECELQKKCFTCFDRVDPSCYNKGKEVPIVNDFTKKKQVLTELCTEGSPLRKRYIAEISCFSLLRTGICTSPDYLGHDLRDAATIEEQCELTKAIRRCIFTVVNQKCGVQAGSLYKDLAAAFLSDDFCASLIASTDLDYTEKSVDEHRVTPEAGGSINTDFFTCPENDTSPECEMLAEIGPIIPPSEYDYFEEKAITDLPAESLSKGSEEISGNFKRINEYFWTETRNKTSKPSAALEKLFNTIKREFQLFPWLRRSREKQFTASNE